uniref:Uncharacterized protein n=1 Tax=Quercus lobata TaxID=97700 RepID=A0A7N2R2D1_QUELO
MVKICIDELQSLSIAMKRSAVAKLRVLGKNRADNQALIDESSAVPALIPLLRCGDLCFFYPLFWEFFMEVLWFCNMLCCWFDLYTLSKF